MDIDLEQEFQLLMRTVIKQIDDKVQRGELTDHEAADLLEMLEDRMQVKAEPFPIPAWNNSGCTIGQEDWPAGVDPETGWEHSRCF